MTQVADLAAFLEEIAPLPLAESWDNVGLLWGDPATSVSRVMTCLTVTSATAAEAVTARADLLVSHHPTLFRAVKRVTARQSDPNRYLWDLARSNIAIISHHTAYDNAAGGINDQLAALLGLEIVGPLLPAGDTALCKVIVFTPETDRERVLAAAFAAGAGHIGNYRECSFRTPGTGTFFGAEETNPTVGQPGRREEAPEERLELICREQDASRIVRAIRQAHSYEEPAIDIYPLTNKLPGPGSGRVGSLPTAETLACLATRVGKLLGTSAVQYAGDPARFVNRVAICCGAGDSFIGSTPGKADVLLTGEARFHRALESIDLGIGLIAAGHHATERLGVEALAGQIQARFPALQVWPSQTESDPWQLASSS